MEPTVFDIPRWVIYAVGIASIFQILLALVLATAAGIAIFILLSIKDETMKHVNHTLENVAHISDDARDTTHNATAAVNRVSNLVGSAATRMESPIIRIVGLASGLAAGARTVKGGKTDVRIEKKRRGFL